MHKKILVIGATGKTGRCLVPMLAGNTVTARPASRKKLTGHVLFDWASPETWQPAVEGINAVYLVGPDLVEDPSGQVTAFLDSARQAGVARVVGLSSLGVSFPHEPPMSGRSKVESAIMGSGLEWTILRPSGFYQNFSEGFFAPGLAAGRVQTATGSGKAAFIDATDIAAVAAVALTQPGHTGQIYALTGPQAFSISEGVEVFARSTGRTISYGALTEDEFRSMMLGFGLPAAFAEVVVRDQLAIRNGFATEVSEVVEQVIGRPPISFAQFVDSVVNVSL
ncbi:NAD(P)H-binding protein [Pelagibacterium lentulum]|uniref:NmrA family protein n=1 Tax=Pelagibacterium lentulum TaxID=2029865 RepID=A0A916R715_9HYPH|nr:NAD(P)H-binding protein [Pelagibacterium lentulum]GGA40424.1 NmrA family protein [Pelagibacterium lentulum]